MPTSSKLFLKHPCLPSLGRLRTAHSYTVSTNHDGSARPNICSERHLKARRAVFRPFLTVTQQGTCTGLYHATSVKYEDPAGHDRNEIYRLNGELYNTREEAVHSPETAAHSASPMLDSLSILLHKLPINDYPSLPSRIELGRVNQHVVVSSQRSVVTPRSKAKASLTRVPGLMGPGYGSSMAILAHGAEEKGPFTGDARPGTSLVRTALG